MLDTRDPFASVNVANHAAEILHGEVVINSSGICCGVVFSDPRWDRWDAADLEECKELIKIVGAGEFDFHSVWTRRPYRWMSATKEDAKFQICGDLDSEEEEILCAEIVLCLAYEDLQVFCDGTWDKHGASSLRLRQAALIRSNASFTRKNGSLQYYRTNLGAKIGTNVRGGFSFSPFGERIRNALLNKVEP